MTLPRRSVSKTSATDLTIGQWYLNKVLPDLKKQIDYDYEVNGQSFTI